MQPNKPTSNETKNMKTSQTSELRRPVNRSPLRLVFLLAPLVLGWCALSPLLQAVVPAPDGGYPGGNTAEGQNALFNLTTGTDNTALGLFSLRSNTTGNFNTATGAGTLLANTADQNTATGAGALLSNTTGLQNTANGAFALLSNTEGNYNTADGKFALFSNTTGESNTANGTEALVDNTTGIANTALGYAALTNNTTGGHNIAVGAGAGGNLTTGGNNIDIGNNGGLGGESATIRIGSPNQTRTFIAGIREITTGIADAIPVLIDSTGQLGTASSSRRFKDQIKPMDSASEAILALKPVTFHYKSDTIGKPQFGLVAEEVAQVNPDLVVRGENGDIYSVRYEAINAMLLNEFLKEHRKVEQLTKDFESKLEAQQRQIKMLISGLEKVTAELEANKPTLRTVADNH
jgi:Chaperone of endosialidase